jgi:hypothetical protein
LRTTRFSAAAFLLEVAPVNLLREPEQRALRIDLLIEARLKTDKFDLRNQLFDHFTAIDRRALHSSVVFVQRAEMIEAE